MMHIGPNTYNNESTFSDMRNTFAMVGQDEELRNYEELFKEIKDGQGEQILKIILTFLL
jgi:hypothetical protein